MALTDKLTAIGEAIREKEGSADLIPLADMPDRIRALSSGGGSGGGDDAMVASWVSMMNSDSSNPCEKVIIPAGVTRVPDYMFSKLAYLEDIEFQDISLITKIGDSAFNETRRLKLSQGLPPNLLTLGQGCFNTSGTTGSGQDSFFPDVLNIPASVTTVGWMAFGSSGVKKVRFLGTPSSIDSKAFNYCPCLTDIYVPWAEGAVANAPWGSQNKNSGVTAPDAAVIHYNTPADAVIE